MLNKTLIYAFVLAVIATALMYANMAKADVVEAGLVGYWSFDNIKGDIVIDDFGDNDGTIIGNPKIVKGICGNALKFGGADYVLMGTNNFPSGKSAMTISAWFYRDTGTGGAVQYIAAFGNWPTATQNFGVGVRGADTVFMTQWGGGVDTFGPAVSLKQWHHVAAVFDGKSTNIIYLDGEEVVTKNISAPNVGDAGGAIGAEPQKSELWNGIIDEVGIYDRALSEDEALQNYEAEGSFVINPAGKLSLTWGEIKASR